MPMKIPNPATDRNLWLDFLSIMDKTFRDVLFDHRAMGVALGRSGLFGGSGRTGMQAVAISAQAANESLNSATMMAKQYRQVCGLMGLILPVKSSRYAITPLMSQLVRIMVDDNKNPSHLYRLFIRSVSNPSPHIPGISPSSLRPMVTVLRTMFNLDNVLHRDELLIGPLTIEDDRDEDEVDDMWRLIRQTRSHGKMAGLNDQVTKHRILLSRGYYSKTYALSKNSYYQNWTRIPQKAVIEAGYCDAVKGRIAGYKDGNSTACRKLKKEALVEVKRIIDMLDYRESDTRNLSSEVRNSFLRLVHSNWLHENEVSPPDKWPLDNDLDTIKKSGDIDIKSLIQNNILHHPYAEQSLQALIEADLMLNPEGWPDSPLITVEMDEIVQAPRLVLHDIHGDITPVSPRARDECPVLEGKWSEMTDIDSIVEIVESYLDCDQSDFYPLVCKLLMICGAPIAREGRTGDINNRFDARIIFPGDETIPIELKSPTEEMKIGLKAIRQAAENKLILHYREPHNDPCKSSLVIGWEIPPERSQMTELINRIHDHYGIKICVIDFCTLVTMVLQRGVLGVEIDWNSLLSHVGIWSIGK